MLKTCAHCADRFEVVRGSKRYCSLKCRLYSRIVETPAGCWEWPGSKIRENSYSQLQLGRGGPKVMIHRLSWEIHNGPIPENLRVLHECDNPPCWRPSHLFLGTAQDNAIDRETKRRGTAKLNADQVRGIRAAIASGLTTMAVGQLFATDHSSVSKIARRRLYAHID